MIKKLTCSLIAFFVFLPTLVLADTPCKLVIYCGITMVKPMVEISEAFEKDTGCQVQFVKGGSGKLLSLLLEHKNGDLFLPGSDSYIQKLESEHPGAIVDKSQVGYNQAAILVKKGNPQKIPAALSALTDDRFAVIIGSAERGSIGKETKKILTNYGNFDQVMKKATITLNSQSLVNAIKAGKADVSINWYAVSTWQENADHVDGLRIDEKFAHKNKLILAVLADSKNPDQAKAFLALAASEKGHALFKKYGLAD
ncbi:extracellular solute-binding protein [Desulfobacter vibrioformis]|uniref:substrate-binding domain-containing protein n=1 Tax=Desulfobacter vibrioformis TaxID=34031 RepID=UPI000689A940|nr:substrate-binding domain-containing protein [Desulfobacter vibrioformis]